MKFESDRVKIVAFIVPTRFYRQSPKVYIDIWPGGSKLIGSLLSSSATYKWTFENNLAETVACIVLTMFQIWQETFT